MKTLILILLVLISGCATSQQNVDLDSCVPRGTIDGIHVARCKPVTQVK